LPTLLICIGLGFGRDLLDLLGVRYRDGNKDVDVATVWPSWAQQTSELSAVNQESEHFIEVDDLTSDPVLHLTDEEDGLPAPPKNKSDGNGKSSQRFIPPRRPA